MDHQDTPELNKRGNIVFRSDAADSRMGGRGGDRYKYDFELCASNKGWKQFDTYKDASYFGVWVHLESRQVFTYCEGDRILVICPTTEAFAAELADAECFYGPPPPAFTVITGNGAVTHHYDTRPTA